VDAERTRLGQIRDQPWRKWGPYLSERQWGTVREDYSENSDAWSYFPHEHARSRAYRWGEDGIAGISDDRQVLCFAVALWNGRDAILKERLFGLDPRQGNHGEDVKEYHFYLDNTPTHSYMKYLYKYPQAAYPYTDLINGNARRSRTEPEYELLDTGVFDDDRYFDVYVEYAKRTPEDILIRITVHNRGPVAATIHVLPTLWYRNQWSWRGAGDKPRLAQMSNGNAHLVVHARDKYLGDRWLWCDGGPQLLFTDNETNNTRLFGMPNAGPYVKDGINDYVVHGRHGVVNPERVGTKVAANYRQTVEAGSSFAVRLCLTNTADTGEGADRFSHRFDELMETRQREADEFYAVLTPEKFDPAATQVMRQALAGMLWSKQFYYYDADRWLKEHGKLFAPPPQGKLDWSHLNNADIISMPDKWKYPCYAAWDLAFHALPLSLVDPDFARDQLDLMLRERYLHPSGKMPAHEGNFDDVGPPVHAWATIFTYRLLQTQDHNGTNWRWLDHTFQKLLLNFNWWMNRKDRAARSVLEGGFLGLDSVGVLNRRTGFTSRVHVEHADGTAWLAFFAQCMCDISVALLEHDPRYVDMVLKFVENFLRIASAMVRLGDDDRPLGMWDESDGFFYDVLRFGDGRAVRLKIRSIVGLIPLCAVAVFEGDLAQQYPEPAERFLRFLDTHPELVGNIHDLRRRGHSGRRLLSILDERRLRLVLARLLDEDEFLGPYGIRSLSRHHAEHPFVIRAGNQEHRIDYTPGESHGGVLGGQSNWCGPVWMPINALIIRALLTYYRYYGDAFRVECPTGSGRWLTLYEVANEITRRLSTVFLPGQDGRRPVFGDSEKFQSDSHWRDHILFYECFNGDTGAGIGASHQTGWTGAIARAMHLFATMTPENVLGRAPLFQRLSALFPNERRSTMHPRGPSDPRR
jgi:hypothetical protein